MKAMKRPFPVETFLRQCHVDLDDARELIRRHGVDEPRDDVLECISTLAEVAATLMGMLERLIDGMELEYPLPKGTWVTDLPVDECVEKFGIIFRQLLDIRGRVIELVNSGSDLAPENSTDACGWLSFPVERQDENVAIVHIEGELDRYFFLGFKDLTDQLIEENIYNVIVNFKDVSYVDSEGLEVLLNCMRALKRFEGEICLCELNVRVAKKIRGKSLCDVFKIFYNEKDALNFIRRGKAESSTD